MGDGRSVILVDLRLDTLVVRKNPRKSYTLSRLTDRVEMCTVAHLTRKFALELEELMRESRVFPIFRPGATTCFRMIYHAVHCSRVRKTYGSYN